jgi:hypothetical protein
MAAIYGLPRIFIQKTAASVSVFVKLRRDKPKAALHFQFARRGFTAYGFGVVGAGAGGGVSLPV